MTAHTRLAELTIEQVQAHVADLRTGDTYERRVRVKCIKEIISEAEAKKAGLDQAIDDDETLITSLKSQLADAQSRLNNHQTEYADCRVAIYKGHMELAEMAHEGRANSNGGEA